MLDVLDVLDVVVELGWALGGTVADGIVGSVEAEFREFSSAATAASWERSFASATASSARRCCSALTAACSLTSSPDNVAADPARAAER